MPKPSHVALFTRAWIEISFTVPVFFTVRVALFTRAWIEMFWSAFISIGVFVALFTRAWIEIPSMKLSPLQG